MIENLLKPEEIKILEDNNVKFTEDYRYGVHENWGGRSIIVYDILYRLVNENMENQGDFKNLWSHPTFKYTYFRPIIPVWD